MRRTAQCCFRLMLSLVLLPAIGVAQNADDGYDPNANNVVKTLAVQPDGKLYKISSDAAECRLF